MNGDIGDGWGAGAISLAFGGGWRKESVDQTLGPDDIIALSMPLNDPRRACVNAGTAPVAAACAACRRSSPPRRTRCSSSRTCSRSAASIRSRKCSPRRCCRSSRASRGVEQLDLTLAARYADYEGSGGIWAWKTGLDWQIHGRRAAAHDRVARHSRGDAVRAVRPPGRGHGRQRPVFERSELHDDADHRRQPEPESGGGRHARVRRRVATDANRRAVDVGRLLRDRHRGRARAGRRAGAHRPVLRRASRRAARKSRAIRSRTASRSSTTRS